MLAESNKPYNFAVATKHRFYKNISAPINHSSFHTRLYIEGTKLYTSSITPHYKCAATLHITRLLTVGTSQIDHGSL